MGGLIMQDILNGGVLHRRDHLATLYRDRPLKPFQGSQKSATVYMYIPLALPLIKSHLEYGHRQFLSKYNRVVRGGEL